MKRQKYEIEESILSDIKLMDEYDLISRYNDFAIEKGYEPFSVNDEEFFKNVEPMEAVRAPFYGDYRYADKFACFNSEGNIDSYDLGRARYTIERDEEFIMWLYDNAYDNEKDWY